MADSSSRASRGPRRHGQDRHGFSSRGSSHGGAGQSGGQKSRGGSGDFRSRHGRGGKSPDSGRGQGRGYNRLQGDERRSSRGGQEGRRSRDDFQRRDSRPPQRQRATEPHVPADVEARELEASARRELRGLGRLNADNVARHLVMVQRLLETDPELAYQHARYAASHAGRIAVVREAAGIAAYLAGHYQDALRDIRAARRLSGRDLHRAIEADSERALGHLGRALKAAEGANPHELDDLEEAEIAMVVSGVRHEMGQTELGLIVIEEAILMFRGDRETARRLHSVRADRLEELGRIEEAQAVRRRIGEFTEDEDEPVQVFDIEDEDEDEDAELAGATATDEAASSEAAQQSDAASAGKTEYLATDSGDDTDATSAGDAANLKAGSADATEDAEDADWDKSFSERVEDELAELLEDAGIQDPAASTTANVAGGEAPTEAPSEENKR